MLRLIFALLFVLFSPQLEALAFAASVKSTGMAGTAIAYPLDSLAGACNPAGMVFIDDRIDLGATWVYERGKIRVDRNPFHRQSEEFDCLNNQTFLLAEFGINKVWCDDCGSWSLGLMAYPTSFQKTHFDRSIPFLEHNRRNLERVAYSISPVLAMGCGDKHGVGISLNWIIERFSHNKHADEECGRHYSHGVSATIGWRWEVATWMALGASYRSKVHMCKCKRERIDLPEKWGGGLLLRPYANLALCADVEWVNWENSSLNDEFQEKHRHKSHHIHDRRRYDFKHEIFKNQTLYSIGIEYQFIDAWTVRAGWRHSNSPTRDNETFLNALAIDTIQDYVTGGVTWLCGCGEVSAFFAYGLENRLSGKHALPNRFKRGHVTLTQSKTLAGLSCAWFY